MGGCGDGILKGMGREREREMREGSEWGDKGRRSLRGGEGIGDSRLRGEGREGQWRDREMEEGSEGEVKERSGWFLLKNKSSGRRRLKCRIKWISEHLTSF